ncbi:HNH endonuclease [Mycobacterium phage Misomonster]|nr:HNH endonuclease [Mycobacterium phage Misomonster]
MVSLSWSTSDRSTRLPDDWPAIRRQVLRDAGWICEIGWSGCLTQATEVDHIRRGDDHSRANLRAACSWCHGKKSSAEATPGSGSYEPGGSDRPNATLAAYSGPGAR